jgi:hypothetical protein
MVNIEGPGEASRTWSVLDLKNDTDIRPVNRVYELGSSVCSSRFVQDRKDLAAIAGRPFGKWKGAYSALPLEHQTNDPTKPPFCDLRLKFPAWERCRVRGVDHRGGSALIRLES